MHSNKTNCLISSNSPQSLKTDCNLNKSAIRFNSVALLCKLCGNTMSAMKCSECLGMQFCYTCDNMYHRHPKRKSHIRKSINLLNNTTSIYFSNDEYNTLHSSSSINNLPNQQIMTSNEPNNFRAKQIRGLDDSVSMMPIGVANDMYQSIGNYNVISNVEPSKVAASHSINMGPIGLPIPPPRKRTLKTQLEKNARKSLSGIEKLNNELKAKLIMSNSPMSWSCRNLIETNHFDMNPQTQYKMNQQINTQKGNNLMNRRQSVDNWQTSIFPQLSSMQNIENTHQLRNYPHLYDDSFKYQHKQISNPYLQRRNHSLTDINSTNFQLLANSFLFYPATLDLNGLSQSTDDILANDDSYSDDNCSSNSSRRYRQSSKKKNNKQINNKSNLNRGSSTNSKNLINEKLIRRSHSSAYLMNPMKLNPHNYVQQNQMFTNLFYAQPLYNRTSISPASSIRSLEPLSNNDLVERKNSARSMHSNRKKYRRIREQNSSSRTKRSTSLCRSKSQMSNRSSKSFRMTNDESNRYTSSDSNDVINNRESEYSPRSTNSSSDESNFDESMQSESERQRKKYDQKQWRCKWCTFVNHYQMNICEMCSKSNPQMLNSKQNEKIINKNSNKTNKMKNTGNIENSTTTCADHKFSVKKVNKLDHYPSNYIEFTDELIKQQEEVEKELLRRIANERLVHEENLKLEKVNDKSRMVTTINSEKENGLKNETKKQINNLIKMKTNSLLLDPLVEPPLLNNLNSTVVSEHNNNIISEIKPSSTNLKQEFTNNLDNDFTTIKSVSNKPVKTQKLNSKNQNWTVGDDKQSGRHREEKYTTQQFGSGKNSDVQQFTCRQYNQRYSIQDRSKEQTKSESIILNEEPIKNSDSFDRKLLDGMKMFEVLRQAENKNYLAEELEIALTFDSTDPISWLDNNWSSMKETVLTLANNQLLIICQKENTDLINTINEEDARNALNLSKGNIWKAIERCVTSKTNEFKERLKSDILIHASNKHDTKNLKSNIKNSCSDLNNINLDESILSKNEISFKTRFNQMEDLLNNWYEKNLRIHNKNESSYQPNTNEKVRNLIAFLKQNGLFDANKQSQNEIDNQMAILMNLLEKKLKETQENNQIIEDEKKNLIDLNNLNVLKNSDESNMSDRSKKLNNFNKLEQELEEIDEKMKKNLNSLQEIENQVNEQLQTNKLKNFSNDQINNLNFEDSNIKNQMSIESEFEDAKDLFNESVHNVNIKLDTPSSVEAIANIKKEKGKIKIIKRKIFRNSLSEQKSFEKIAYVNNIKEADLINLDDEMILNMINNEKENDPEELLDHNNQVNNENEKNQDRQLLIDDDVEKRLNQLNPNFGFARTIYECGICCNKHHINELISMLSCEHKACKSCLEKYYTIQIREKQRVLIKCPFCDQPEIQSDDENSVHEYLILLQELIKNIVTKDLYELFQRKVRDRTLQKEPGFRWCVNCSSGFLHNKDIEENVLKCPDCQSLSCSKCGELWKDEHQFLDCEQFKKFLSSGSQYINEHRLNIHLNEYGIICPKCHFRYELSKGGCLHFKCVQCEHEFCYGCDASFKTGDKCSLYGKSCERLGFHAHHPRNCLFYLRDKKYEDLEKLLKLNNVDFEIQNYNPNKIECDIMEQKDINSELKDEACKRPVKKYGICSIHYIEHLAKLIKCNHIDPIAIFEENELLSVLKREQIDAPKKLDIESDYKSKLIETIKSHLPLI